MSVIVEAGRFYRTDAGGKVGPTRRISYSPHSPWPFVCDFADSKTGLLYVKLNGETQSGMGDHTTPNLIAEWTDAPTIPVRSVTRKEPIPGVYGRLAVLPCDIFGRVLLKFADAGGEVEEQATGHYMDAAQVKALAEALTQISEALESHTQ